MIGFPLIALLLVTMPQSTGHAATMTQTHQRDLGCIAFFGIAAAKQRQGIAGYEMIPDVRSDGPRWARIVGERVMRETGLPQEVVGYAIQEAVPAVQRSFMLPNPYPEIEAQLAYCTPRMQHDLAEADAVLQPLPKPQKPRKQP